MKLNTSNGRLLSWQELIATALLILPPLVTVSLIEDADWVEGLPSLKLLLTLTLIISIFVARSRVSGLFSHPLALLIGAVAAFLIGVVTLSESSGLYELASQISSWFGDIGSKDGNRGTAMTGVFLIAVTLWMGYSTAWLAYRRSTALLATLPSLGVLLVVLTFLPTSFYWYFFMLLLAAAPGIAYRYKGLSNWSGNRRTSLTTSIAGLALMAIVVGPVWQSPTPDEPVIPLASTFEESVYSFREQWSNLLYGVPNRNYTPRFTPPEALYFTEPADLSDEVLFVVASVEPHRWRMRVHEVYASTGWIADTPTIELSTQEAPLIGYVEGLKERRNVEIDVRIHAKTTTLMSAGEPLAADIVTKVELASPLDSDGEILQSDTNGGSVSVSTEDAGPPLALLGDRTMLPPRQYKTIGSISEATPAMLKGASEDYPETVTDRYLQLPDDFPEGVKELARDLTRNEDNPYDKAEAIRQHLATLPYSLDVKPPPPGVDWVENFLLVQGRGFCLNYASSMITMLRSLDIPSRLVVGFAPGIWSQDRGIWEVQWRHYHAWPEVYFPEYGWIEFEPTPADVQPSLQHLGFLPSGDLARLPPGDALIGDLGLREEISLPEGGSLEQADEPIDLNWILGGIVIALITGALLLLLFVAYRRISALGGGHPYSTYYSMCILGRLAGEGPSSYETPWEYSSRLMRAFPDYAEQISLIAQQFILASYSPSKIPSMGELERVQSAWSSFRGTLLRRILIRMIPWRRNKYAYRIS